MNTEVFKPIRGTEASILNSPKIKGGLYFALDTRKVFYCDGESFLSMGGNSGVYYGSMTLDETPDTDVTDFTFSLDDIEGDYIPNEDDLILNIPDGCFYRVNGITQDDDITLIETTKLTIAGSGGGSGGGGGSTGVILKVKNNLNSMTVYCVDDQDAEISFNVSSSAADDSISQIIYKIGTGGSIATVIDEDGHDMGDISFNLKPYISSLSTATAIPMAVVIIDIYGVQKTLNYILNRVSISLTEDVNTPTILQASNGILDYQCKPVGGGNLLNKKIVYTIYDGNNNLLTTKEHNFSSSGITQSYTINFTEIDNIGIGTYYIEVKYIGYTSNNSDSPIESNILSHSVISYSDTPLLVAYAGTNSIEQYSNLEISYMINTSDTSLATTTITLTKNGVSSVQEVSYNQMYIWTIYFDTPGYYDLSLSDKFGHVVNFNNFLVTEYAGEIPIIDNTLNSLKLNLTTTNRSNTEIYKNSWEDRTFTTNFEKFIWGRLNGWLIDDNGTNMLRLSSGAKITIDSPTKKWFNDDDRPDHAIVGAMNDKGYTIELDFKVSGITDFSKPLISCVSMGNSDDIQVGFQITGQTSTLNTANIKASTGSIIEDDSDEAQAYNTQIQGLTTKFIENERIHLTWVIGKNTATHPIIKTYLNGILSGMAEYSRTDYMRENTTNKAKLIFDSTYGIIDIYNIRVYNTELDSDIILKNYIATLDTLEEKFEKYNDNFGLLDSDSKVSINSIEHGSYSLKIPYIKFMGGASLTKDDTGYALNTGDNSIHLPYYKKDYRLVDQFDFIDPTHTHKDVHLTSSFKDGYLNGVTFYGQGTSSMEYPIKNLRVKFKMKDENGKKVKFQINPDDYPVDILTLKADYMESSSSHNTGTANLIFNLLENNKMYTPGQQFYNQKNPDYKTLTAIRGYPIICFFSKDNGLSYEYIGRYNLNMDKSSEDVFGFLPYPAENPEDVEPAERFGWAAAADTETNVESGLVNTIHCYEFLNNASNLANFLGTTGETFEQSFYKEVIDPSSNRMVPNWFLSFESRYPEGEAKNGSDVDIKSWFELCKWVNSTATTEATGQNGDTVESRLLKFKNEFEDHFNLKFATFYYVLTHVLLMIDSRAKNMMMATWDNQHWYPIFYDMDTMLGLNNYGYNKFDYNVEDTNANIFNGQNSVLWNNFRECFQEEIRTMYNTLEKSYLNYNGLLHNYNDVQADAWNEILYNTDAEYKYLNPYVNGYYNGLSGEAIWVEPGKKNYLYAAQGNRSMHRKYWLKNRLNYFDGKYLSDTYKMDRFMMRLYTPDREDNYYKVNITEEDFIPNTYYTRAENNGTYIFTLAETYSIGIDYFAKADSKLNESVIAVQPNNNFTLTPLYNQYLSVAFGGDNGVTTNPIYTAANVPQLIEAPSGSHFNDTETYVYGGSSLKDLGDLSSQYLGLFVFPDKQTKLENLTLGNLNNKYYNPNFSALTIGTSAPYLKTINIANCSGLQVDIDLSACQSLNQVLATGTQLKGIMLPEHGVISELRLPTTLRQLILVDQPNLTTNNFTIGTYNSDTETYSENNYENLIYVKIDNVSNLNSYPIALQAPLQDFAFININWEPAVEEIDVENATINVLEKLLAKNNENEHLVRPIINNSFEQSLTGTLTIPAINDNKALEIYEKYWKQFPNLNFVFTSENIVWVNVYDGNNNLYWSRPAIKNSVINSSFLREGTSDALLEPSKDMTPQYTFNFDNWLIDDESYNTLDGIEITSDLNIHATFTETVNSYLITFKQDDEILYEITATYGTPINTILPPFIPAKEDNNLEIYETYAFLGYAHRNTDKEVINFNNNIMVTGKTVYYAIFTETPVDTGDPLCVHNENFEFTLITQGYEDTINSEFNIAEGYSVQPAAGRQLKGKITIPAVYNNKPVIEVTGFGSNNSYVNAQPNITGIYFESGTKVRIFRDYAFAYLSNLLYAEIPNSVRIINSRAFISCPNLRLIPRGYSKETTEYVLGGQNVYSVGEGAFTNCVDRRCTKIFIPSNIRNVSRNSFSNFNASTSVLTEIQIGTEQNPSLMIFGDSNLQIIRMNTDLGSQMIQSISIYIPSSNLIDDLIIQNQLNPYAGIRDVHIDITRV